MRADNQRLPFPFSTQAGKHIPRVINTDIIQFLSEEQLLYELCSLLLLKRGCRNLLDLNCKLEVERICDVIRQQVFYNFHKKGVVVGLSGGVDSSTVAALAARALGPERVLVLLMPAAFTTPVRPPNSFVAVAIARCTSPSTVTSVFTKRALAPSRRRKAASLAPNPALIQIMLAQAILAANEHANADEVLSLLQSVLTREPESPDAYAQLAMAYARKGDLGNADLASAKAAFMRGDLRTARQLATRAKTHFPVGSPGWVKSDDIATYKPTTTNAQR